MKTLTDHTIVYDDECPLCREYTRAFVKTGMLDSKGRESYSTMVGTEIPNIDWGRARNEIALINRTDGTILYGIDSLMAILSHRFPFLKRLFRVRAFRSAVQLFYFFISYNRKVIAPGKVFEGRNTCTPDLNYPYRWAYIVFAWLVTSIILVAYSRLAIPLIPASGFAREFLICGGQILFQGAIVFLVHKERAIHYLGNLMTVSLGGALLLSPMFLLVHLIQSSFFYVGYFMVVVMLMFLEHLRRVKILEMPFYLTATWVLYRLTVLFIIYLVP